MAVDLSVRVAEARDIEFVVASIRGLADYEKLSAECMPDAKKLSEHLFGTNRYAEAWIAEIGAERVGYALCFPTYSTFLTCPGMFVEDLFVRPAHRGRGAGRALLDAVVKSASERGFARVEWSVLDWNEPAIRFYRAYGAKPQDQWTIYRLADVSLTTESDRSGNGG
jgi:GNAT superfamily N-acetyltransferase